MNTTDDPRLTAYALGEMSEAERAAFEAGKLKYGFRPRAVASAPSSRNRQTAQSNALRAFLFP